MYGPSGAGKKTRMVCILRELYGPGVEKLRIEHMEFVVSFYDAFEWTFEYFQTPSKKKIEISTVASNYHIEMNPRWP